MKLTDPQFISRLDALYLLARRVLGGSMQADRRTTRKGSGIDFADYAEYQHGDDYRAIDWRVYGRLEQLLIKLFEVEEDTSVYLLMDHSPSMESKFIEAKRLVAALGYIALNSLDRVALYGISDQLRPILPLSRGRAKALPFLSAVEEAEIQGKDTSFTQCCKSLRARHRKKGIVLIISDFLFPSGYAEGLRILQGMKHDIFCLQIHDPADLECDWLGDALLTCTETGEVKKVTVNETQAATYNRLIKEYNEGLRTHCRGKGIGLTSITKEENFETVVQSLLRKGGLVK